MTAPRLVIALTVLVSIGACAAAQASYIVEATALAAGLRGAPGHNHVPCTMRSPASTSKTFSPNTADSLVIGRNKVHIPAGALRQSEQLRLVVMAGSKHQMMVRPAGKDTLTFLAPIRLEMDIRGCTPANANTLFISQENPSTGDPERLPLMVRTDTTVTAQARHLSFFTLAQP